MLYKDQYGWERGVVVGHIVVMGKDGWIEAERASLDTWEAVTTYDALPEFKAGIKQGRVSYRWMHGKDATGEAMRDAMESRVCDYA